MNIEIANRLVNLRKQKSLSQEALAEKLGISRQAVSKWERAEASPDTDNLILLARLYGISLDTLLQTEDEIPMIREMSGEKENLGNDNDLKYDSETSYNNEYQYNTQHAEDENQKNSEYVHIGLGGIHVQDKDGSEVHVGWNGIHVDDKTNQDNVHIDKNGVYINGEKHTVAEMFSPYYLPIDLIMIIVYLIIGVFWNAWHPGWLIFLLIPLWHTFVSAIKQKDFNVFSYPVLATLIFLMAGFFWDAWHPGWVIFLTIPLFYSLVNTISHYRKNKEEV